MSRAAIKALDLLEAVARATAAGLGSTEAAAAAGLDKTTASRLLGMLTERGWLARDPRGRQYFPGKVLIEVAHASGVAERLPSSVDALLAGLQELTGETVALHQLVGRVRLCVAGVECTEEVRSVLQSGETRPLDRGASSRVILAFCPGWLQQQLLDEQADDAGRELLATQLDDVATSGHLSIESDQPGGSAAVAVPLFTDAGVYGAIAVAGPAARFVRPRRDACVTELLGAAREVTGLLGGSPDRYTEWLGR